MKKEDVLRKAKSYSTYKGITSSNRYKLTDKYIYVEFEGNAICTDREYDRNKNGNIVLVTKEYDVLPIGYVPIPETGEVKFSMDKNGFLHLQYKVLDGEDEEEIIDCHLTKERKTYIEILRKVKELMALKIGGYDNSKYHTTYEIVPQIAENRILLCGSIQKKRGHGSGIVKYAEQEVTYQHGKFILQPPTEGKLPIENALLHEEYQKLLSILDSEVGIDTDN